MVSNLRQTFMQAVVKLPYKWSFGASFINYELKDVLREFGFSIVSNGRVTWVTRLTYVSVVKEEVK